MVRGPASSYPDPIAAMVTAVTAIAMGSPVP
jgi:hypothetical protein